MSKEIADALLAGSSLSGTVRLFAEEDVVVAPGRIRFEEGQVVVSVVAPEYSRLVATLQPSMYSEINGATVLPYRLSERAIFETRHGALTLIQLGRPRMLNYKIGCPIEYEIRPRFSVLRELDEDHWKRPIEIKSQVGGLAAWIHGESIRRRVVNERRDPSSGERIIELIVRDAPGQEFDLPQAGLRLTVNSEAYTVNLDEGDGITMSFRATAALSPFDTTTWSQLLDQLDTFQELLELLSWSGLDLSVLHCRFGAETSGDPEFWEKIGLDPPPKPEPDPWVRVLTSVANDQEPALVRSTAFALPFSSVTPTMLDRWFQMRRTYAEGLRQILALLHGSAISPEVRTLQLGAGIERLGYKLIAEETSKTKADSIPTVEYFKRIGETAVRLFSDEYKEWPTLANQHYQAMKHLRKEQPSPAELERINDLSILAIQCWLASELGGSDPEIRTFAEHTNRLTSRYQPVPDPAELD